MVLVPLVDDSYEVVPFLKHVLFEVKGKRPSLILIDLIDGFHGVTPSLPL